MTIEERAQKSLGDLTAFLGASATGRAITGDDLVAGVAQGMRDLIEDCAKIADNEAEQWSKDSMGELAASTIADKIRVLAL